MANIPALTDSLSEAGAFACRVADPLPARMAALAESGRAAASAVACVIGWNGRAGSSWVRAPADDPQFDGLESAVRAMLANRGVEPRRILRAGAAELATTFGRPTIPANLTLHAAMAGEGRSSAIAMLVTAPESERSELEALLQPVLSAALEIIAAEEGAESLRFWKEHAVSADAELARTRLEAEQREADRKRIEAAVSDAARPGVGDAASRIGRIVAAFGRFDAWLIAVHEGNSLRVEACSPLLGDQAKKRRFDGHNALFENFRRGVAALEYLTARPNERREDLLFTGNGFASYLCVPWSAGVIALAARRLVDAAEVARTSALVARLAPIIEASRLEHEAEAQRALMQRMALRAYGAVDAALGRIARDLHDDEAQLLASAQIAIKAPRAKARAILHRLEAGLRERVRALRPASLGRRTLRMALERESKRLADAGIEARLVWARGVRVLSREMQNVLYQVAREVVSNVIRHSGARRVEFRLERMGDRVRLAISDDGRGLRTETKNRGTGLSGLAERVELVGGKLRIESRPGHTAVISEIPAPLSSLRPKRAKRVR